MIEYMQHKLFWLVPEERRKEEESEAKVSTFPHILFVFQHTRGKQNTC